MVDLMFPNIFSSIMLVEKIDYFQTPGNEAMKHIFLLFNGFHRTRIFDSLSTLFRIGGGEKCKNFPC